MDEGSTLDHDSEIAEEAPTPTIPVVTQASRRGFESMDLVILLEIWKIRGNLMKVVECTGWRCGKLWKPSLFVRPGFFSVPRMFLFRPSRGGQVPKKALLTRVDLFSSGQWSELVEMSVTSSVDVANAQARRRRETQRDIVEKRALRAFHIVQLSEVSARATGSRGSKFGDR